MTMQKTGFQQNKNLLKGKKHAAFCHSRSADSGLMSIIVKIHIYILCLPSGPFYLIPRAILAYRDILSFDQGGFQTILTSVSLISGISSSTYFT